jgi:glycosyltransferase involved in cell wall biosynthesis
MALEQPVAIVYRPQNDVVADTVANRCRSRYYSDLIQHRDMRGILRALAKNQVVWFNKEIWPQVKANHPGIKLVIIGKHADGRLKEIAKADNQVELTGFVENVEPYFRKSRVFITPLRFGSGIKVKVINALYRGIPCVTTSIGTEGLKVKDGESIFIKDQPEAFVKAIDTLLTDKNTWEKIRTNSREIARQYYTWEAVLENIERAIND